MHTAQAIQNAPMSPAVKVIAEAIRATTATALQISAANVSLEEKLVLRSALAGTETQAGIGAALIELPLKSAILGA